MRRIIYSAITLIIMFAFSGCASMSDILKSKDEGLKRDYNVSTDKAWEIAITVLRWEGCETIEQHRNEGYLLTTTAANFVTAGTLVGVWFDEISSDLTKVTIVTKRKIQTNLATGLTENTFHKRFAQAVEIVKSGNPLPIEPPDYK